MLNEDNLIDLFVKTWRNLDAEIIIPYLAPDFQYSSCWVYSSLDCKGYTDYIRGKFETIRKANYQIVVEKGRNEIGKPAVVLTQGGEKIYLTIEAKDGKIKKADLMPFYAMQQMKRILLTAISLAALLLFLFLTTGRSTPKDLDERAEEALEYCKENGYSTEYCLLVDYGRHSGRVRFFIWDFKKDKPVLKSLCAHGYGKGSTARRPVFSNEIGSFCSSLGHYRVGKEKTMSKPKGRKALLLYGRDKTNSNALWRGILIHPVSLPNFSIYPLLIPVKVHKIRPKSEGCITIPFRKYSKVSETVESSSKPLVLWVYE